MDVYCTHCGEPWDLDHVLHEEPHAFEKLGEAIIACPSCPKEKARERDPEERAKLRAARELGELLSGDPDGYASMLEDLGLEDI